MHLHPVADSPTRRLPGRGAPARHTRIPRIRLAGAPHSSQVAGQRDGGSRSASSGPAPKLSFVLCSRNDGYAGNALWRLQTALNVLGVQVAQLGDTAPGVEAVVCDWGSPERSLREALALRPEAAAITRVVEVPPAVAAAHQQDSPFAEVIANNAAIRRARGRHIARIDQDTLVGGAFLRRMIARPAPPVSSGRFELLFSGRRSVPFAFARRSAAFERVCAFLDTFHRVLPREGACQQPWFDAPVGVVLLHRDHWEACRGYDERMLYWGFMETDLALRIQMRGRVADLERELGCPFYHLGHTRSRLQESPRRKNPRVAPRVFAPNGPGWGLADYDLPVRRVPATPVDASPVPRGEALRFLPAVVAERGWQRLLAASRLVRGVVAGDRVEAAAPPSPPWAWLGEPESPTR